MNISASSVDMLLAARATGRMNGTGERARIVSAELAAAPPNVAEALDIEPDTPVIRRSRITMRDDNPRSVSISWFPANLADVAPALLLPERIVQGTARYIEERTGRTIQFVAEEVTAAPAAPDVAESLGVPHGEPVLLGRTYFQDDKDAVVEFGEFASPPGLRRMYWQRLRNDEPTMPQEQADNGQ